MVLAVLAPNLASQESGLIHSSKIIDMERKQIALMRASWLPVKPQSMRELLKKREKRDDPSSFKQKTAGNGKK
uniref:Uncharacterized protein n=1 Tax=Ditylenchus dipsaci TaxID=166011 RepID=A0A915EB84_9BILA